MTLLRVSGTGGLVALAGLGLIGFLATRPLPPRPARPRRRVVVLGAGFGGLAAAQRLHGRKGIDLTVIDTHNHHLFQPLLYQVATAALSPADIASAVRGVLPPTRDSHVRRATVTGIDPAARLVHCGEGEPVPYDELIVATGSRPSYFGHDDWAKAAPGLKTLDDALVLRRRVLEAFERASACSDEAERRRRLCFVLIGGGPTGVEMAGAIAELAHDTLPRDYALSPDLARIVLIEGSEHILSAFAPDLRDYARRALRRMDVEVLTGTKVTGIEPGVVHTEAGAFSSGCIVWTAGTEATPVADWLGVKPGKGGRVPVGADLRLPSHPEIAVIGDAALALDGKGQPLPGLAPVAKQGGGFVAWTILRRAAGGRARRRFRYVDFGNLATIGRNKAVAEFGSVHLSGFPAWITWAVAHIFFLIGFRNRLLVSAQWAFAYASHERAGRLIVPSEAQDREVQEGAGQAKKKAIPNRM